MQIYLSDHLTGASGVISRVGWMVERYAGTSAEPVLLRLLEELRQERRVVRGLAEHLGVRLSPWKPVAAVAAERAGRLKPNGRLTSKSPLSLQLELEALRSGISGKRSLWATLEVWSAALRLDRARLAGLRAQADDQVRAVDELAERVRTVAFATEAAVPDITADASPI
ncbi:hypothetical protein OMK64_05025 [Cellulomonas fimi]|uniref:hypothetical protein n=1 Tax=Cellulomonas fimi TaxID=1708 RepID=UPI00234C9A0D|nr:hypothetical protein [Cellulomonas fimi]MDC7120891.1 hypothetical protein [Cellulomonas fimi]